MRLAPDSELIREYNPCHDPQTGRFSASTEGRCAQGAAEARRELAKHLRWARGLVRRGAKPVDGGTYDDAVRRVSSRRAAAAGLPDYLHSDILRARKEHRATVQPLVPAVMGVQRRGSSAEILTRSVVLDPDGDRNLYGEGSRRVAALTTLRHELGHIAPDSLKRTGRLVGTTVEDLTATAQKWTRRQFHRGLIPQWSLLGGLQVDLKVFKESEARVRLYLEEVRAWRNAIKHSNGRVSMRVMRKALSSYAGFALGAEGGQGHEGGTSRGDLIHRGVVEHLRRYARAVRRRARSAK